ncbi:pilus assembly protein [Moraxella oculi]|uniref:PilC beta-propeller domain-containing protein n=1 Tax=Moraxella oculi TaxID=2940516 RepID=A0ABW8U3T3_9GAMM
MSIDLCLRSVFFLALMKVLLCAMPAVAMQYGSGLLQIHSSSCPADTPIITGIHAASNHAHLSLAYHDGRDWRGGLLKYPISNAIVMGADGSALHNSHQALRPDVWAVDDTLRHFGTQGQSDPNDHHIWLLKDKYDDHDGRLVKLVAGDEHVVKRLLNYSENELNNIAEMIQDQTIGAVMYPSDDDAKTGLLLYADHKGVLRVIDDAGRQKMAYLPKNVLGKPYGIDAIWRLHRVRVYDEQGWVERLIGIGGFGRSAYGLMAIDLTDISHPRVLYHLNTDELPRLSHIHAPVSMGYLWQDGRRVATFVFGGGIDECYQGNTHCHKSVAQGSAVYVIDALTGKLLHEWHDDMSNTYMKHGFASQMTLVDRQGDGVFEHIYAADLGGQIFRLNVNDGDAVRVFSANDDESLANDLFGIHHQRFYQKPIITLYDSHRHPRPFGRHRRFALISIASSDQLPMMTGKVNRVYGIFDDGLIDLNDHPTIFIDELVEIDDQVHTPIEWLGKVAQSKGWTRALNIGGDTNVTLMNDGVIIPSMTKSSRLGATAFYHLNPVKIADCLHEMVVEPQAFCLPFGVCASHRKQKAVGNTWHDATGTAMIQGNWPTSMVKSNDGESLTWRILMPNKKVADESGIKMLDDMQDDERIKDIASSVSSPFERTVRFLRWYDVRSTKD